MGHFEPLSDNNNRQIFCADIPLNMRCGAAWLKQEKTETDDTAAATKAASASICTVLIFGRPLNSRGAPPKKINTTGHNKSIPPNNSQIYRLLGTTMLP